MPLAATVTPRTEKIIKNGLRVFERGENLLQNGILHFVFRWKVSFSERGLALKGLRLGYYKSFFENDNFYKFY